jgi:hypothetical protein
MSQPNNIVVIVYISEDIGVRKIDDRVNSCLSRNCKVTCRGVWEQYIIRVVRAKETSSLSSDTQVPGSSVKLQWKGSSFTQNQRPFSEVLWSA